MVAFLKVWPGPFQAAIALAAVLAWSSQAAAQKEGSTRVQELQQLAAKFKVEISVADKPFSEATPHGPIEGQAAAQRAVQVYAPLFVQEFSKYPLELVTRLRLKKVVLCQELSFDGQRRSAVPDWWNDILYLDVARGTHSPKYMRKVIHHELYHLIDFRDDGLVYVDLAWSALNPPGFAYGAGGISAQENPGTSALTTQYPGFINHYSTTGVEEDKAEIFANLVVEAEFMARLASQDLVMGAKVALLKRQLVEFCPALNESFWQRGRTPLLAAAPAQYLEALPGEGLPAVLVCNGVLPIGSVYDGQATVGSCGTTQYVAANVETCSAAGPAISFGCPPRAIVRRWARRPIGRRCWRPVGWSMGCRLVHLKPCHCKRPHL